MAKIDLISVVKRGHGRMEDVVFGSWKGKPFMKAYKEPKKTNTEAQQKVRNAFKAVGRNWKSMGGIIKESWNAYVKDKALTAYSAFIKANLKVVIDGGLMNLFSGMGENPLANFVAEKGSKSGEISVSYGPVDTGRFVTFFVQKKENASEGGAILRVDGGQDLNSPYVIQGLEAGKEYAVYGVVTDVAYDQAEKVSSSAGAFATAA